MKKKILLGTLLPLLLILSACNGTPASPTPVEISTEAASVMLTETETSTPSTAPTQSPTFTPQPASDGPFLLIQTDAQTYKIIDFALGEQYPVELPVEGRRIGISGSLSPSKTVLKLPIEDNQLKLFNFITSYLQTIDLPNDSFDADQTAELAQTAFDGIGLSYEAALDGVLASYTSSIANTQWYQDDDHLLAVTTGSPTSTHLSLVDVATGQVEALESLPGLVERFTLSGDWALLKKGYINEPGYAGDDQYYALNLDTLETILIDLPADADNPILAWFGGTTLSIIHQSQPVGGINFSLLDLENMSSTQVIDGMFSSIQSFQNGLLVLRMDSETYATIIQIVDLSGQILKETSLNDRCSPVEVTNEAIILNCETESLILDSELIAESFSDPIFLLSSSTDGESWVRVNRSGQTALLDSSFTNPQPIKLEGAALEVRWLPNSPAFLYRTLGKLYLYDLAEGSSTLVLESDLLGDYANTNAAWIFIPD
ncbi:hypothetical protein JR338_01055 [Chloroflexota bacterium]|nr:hypothetical protein JR338_01055 [Chloroflexota bacterium]